MARSSICVSISWRSNRTRDRGVVRSTVVSEALLVVVTRLLANETGLKLGDRKVSWFMYEVSPLVAMMMLEGDEQEMFVQCSVAKC